MEEINKYLTEAMGGEWFDKYCKHPHHTNCHAPNTDFLTWGGFGKLWEWARKQEWWEYFQDMVIGDSEVYTDGDITRRIDEEYVNPEKLAKAVANFLQKTNKVIKE